jgi:hypothetical protein
MNQQRMGSQNHRKKLQQERQGYSGSGLENEESTKRTSLL